MIKFGFSFILIIFFTVSYAANADNLEAKLNIIQTMQANFVQTVYNNHHKAVQQSVGRMSLSRPGKFHWQVEKPIPQTVIANGTRLWIYDPDLQQVTIRALQQTTGEAPALLLSHEDSGLAKDFAIQQSIKPGNVIWFILIPKNADSNFAKVEFGFKQNQINEMRLQDQLGHTTQIQFKNVVLNKKISANIFNFKPPANVDIIDETRKKAR